MKFGPGNMNELVKTIQVDNVHELNIWLNENANGWDPFHIQENPDNDKVFQKNYTVWLKWRRI